jgi:hypothetical protein
MAWFDESVEAPNTLRQAGQYNSLGDIPLVVPAFTRPSKPVDGNDLRNTWLELQQELTLLSENSKTKMLGESGHYIQFDQPKEVIEAIRAVVQQCLSIQTP